MEKLNLKGTRIVLVDDDADYLFSAKNILEDNGISVHTIGNPMEGIEYLKKNKTDILLLDYFMPTMNGDEFIEKVREFDREIIIILQTGFSDKKPPIEMLQELNIQGYHDKTKGIEELILLIMSATKTLYLLKTIKEKDMRLDAQSCRNEFLGKFLNRLMGEIGERSMAMAGSVVHLSEMQNVIPEHEKEVFVNSVSTMKNNTAKLNELIKSLEISQDIITIGELERRLINLFDLTLSIKDVKLNIRYDDQYTMLNCNQEIIIHILVDIIEFLLENNEKEINILVTKDENVQIKVCNNISNSEVIDKLKKLAYLDERLDVSIEFEQIVVKIG